MPMRIHIRSRSGSRDGIALILVLAFIVLLTILIVSFLAFIRLNGASSADYAKSIQAQEIAQGGLQDILSDLHSEIIAGSTVLTNNSASYPPAYIPITNYTAVPARLGYVATAFGNAASATTLPSTVVRVSRASQDSTPTHFYPNTAFNTSYYTNMAPTAPNGATLLNRASNANSSAPSVNGRSISPARWNKTFLLASTTGTSGGAGFQIPTTFANTTTAPYGPPDWVYVTRAGSTVISDVKTALPTPLNGTQLNTANASPAVGRYAYVVYDEGALLDANVAGSPSALITGDPALPVTTPLPNYTTAPSAAVAANLAFTGKSYLAFADLTQLPGLTHAQAAVIDPFVNWRNAGTVASLGGSSGVNYLQAVFKYGQSGFLDFQTSGSVGDSPLISRQDLINYFANPNLDPHFNTAAATYSQALPYLGTFSRGLSAPSYMPRIDSQNLPGYWATTGVSPVSYAADAENPGNLNGVIANRDLANVRWPQKTSIIHYNDDSTPTNYSVNAGDPFLQSRFSLARINWLSQVSPQPSDNKTSLSTAYATAIQACFGLTWGVVGTNANGGNACWSYVGSPGSTFSGAIETLDQVASENREPNFFEMLKAGILSGSLGLSPGPAAFNNAVGWPSSPYNGGIPYNHSGTTKSFFDVYYSDLVPLHVGSGGAGLYSYSFDVSTTPSLPAPSRISDMQIMQIGANIIDQYDSDGYPTAIYFQYPGLDSIHDAATSHSGAQLFGPVDMVYGEENLPYLQNVGVAAVTTDGKTQGDLGANGLGGWWQPVLYNPHQMPATTPSVAPPQTFMMQGYGQTHLTWSAPAQPKGTPPVPQPPVTGITSNTLDGESISFTDNTASSSFYAKPVPFTKTGISSVSNILTSDPGNMLSNSAMFDYTENPFVGFWMGTDPTYRNSSPSTGYPPMLPGGNYNFANDPSGTTTFILGWSDSASKFHPYSYMTGIFGYAYGNPPDTGDAVPKEYKQYLDLRTQRFAPLPQWAGGYPIRGTLYPSNIPRIPNINDTNAWGTAGAPQSLQKHFAYVDDGYGFFDVDWEVNQATPPSTTGASATYYSDPDGVVRPGDGLYGNPSTGDGMLLFGSNASPTPTGNTFATGDKNGNAQHGRRPVILNRPFRSVGELGYAFRDLPFKTLDFFSPESADAALLDVFSITDECKIADGRISSLAAGQVNLNNAPVPVIQAILAGGSKKDLDPTYNTSTEASTIAQNLASQVSPSSTTGPILNRADLVTKLSASLQSGFTTSPDKGNKAYLEAPVRALADVTNTRTWNLLIDIIAQSGHISPTAATLNDFIVEGERRYWLHIAIDRYTGKIIDQQLETVYE